MITDEQFARIRKFSPEQWETIAKTVWQGSKGLAKTAKTHHVPYLMGKAVEGLRLALLMRDLVQELRGVKTASVSCTAQ